MYKIGSMRYLKRRSGFLVQSKGWVRFVGSHVPQLFLALFTGFGIY